MKMLKDKVKFGSEELDKKKEKNKRHVNNLDDKLNKKKE